MADTADATPREVSRAEAREMIGFSADAALEVVHVTPESII